MFPYGRRVFTKAKEVALLRRPLEGNAVGVLVVLELRVASFHKLFRALVVPAVVPLQEHVALLGASSPEFSTAGFVPL